jgi:hypothetical protein
MEGAPSASSIGKKAAEENWTGEREKFRREVEKRIADRTADEIAAARILHANVSKAAIIKGSQILAQVSSEKGNLRDAARLLQVGITHHRQAHGMDRPEVPTDEWFDQIKHMFIEFLSSEEVGLSEEEAAHTIGEFVAFLRKKRPRP